MTDQKELDQNGVEVVSTEGILFDTFYRTHGTRTPRQLVDLKSTKLVDFDIPTNTTLHIGYRDLETLGLPEDDTIFNHAGHTIFTGFVQKYVGETVGKYTKVNFSFQRYITAFLKDNPRMKSLATNQTAVLQPNSRIVVNHSCVDEAYKYSQPTYEALDRRINFYTNLLRTAQTHYKETKRQQILLIDGGSELIALSKLTTLQNQWVSAKERNKQFTSSVTTELNTDSKFILFQYWLWVGDFSKFSIFNEIEPEVAENMHLMFVVDGKYVVIRLSEIEQWISRPDESRKRTGVFTPKRTQSIVLRFFIGLQHLKTQGDDTEIVDLDEATSVDEKDQTPQDKANIEYTKSRIAGDLKPTLDVNIDASGTQDKLDIKAMAKPEYDKITARLTDIDPEDPTLLGMSDEINQLLGSEVDQDIKQLEVIEAQKDADKVNLVKDYTKYTPPEKHDDPIAQYDRMVDNYASQGILSPAEIRRAKALARKVEELKSPFDETKTIAEFGKISQEDLQIKPEDTVVTKKDKKGVPDKSMKHSSMHLFDKRYLDEILEKDITNVFMHAQKSGIAVTNFDRQISHDYLGSKQTFSVQLTPIIGEPTTVKVVIPVFNNDGIFQSNKVKYKMKKQRVDRKIDVMSVKTSNNQWQLTRRF